MSDTIASERFSSTVDYASLPSEKLQSLFAQASAAHESFYQIWQNAISDRFGEAVREEMTQQIYPNLATLDGDMRALFYEELNFIRLIVPDLQHMLTFARYKENLLPQELHADLDLTAFSNDALLLLWNIATLTYVMQTSRWTETVTRRFDQDTALKLERSVWLDYGAAEEDLRYGLIAAGSDTGNVETLLRGFQFAPGEVGLVDAEFHLESPEHGWITHKRCPALDRFAETNNERLESSCVLCVIAMRLSGEIVNKDIRCRAASIPPYRDNPGYACKWEYWL